MTMVRALAGLLALNRVAFGIGYIAAPERTARSWIGRAAKAEGTKVFTRALGARDLALGAGALRALTRPGADPRPWFAAHAVADATDFAATLAGRRRLPDDGVRFALAMAGASTAIALAGAVASAPGPAAPTAGTAP